MGLFSKVADKFVKKEKDLYAENNTVFIVHLFMKELCPTPDKDFATAIMEKHLGEIDRVSYDEENAIFAPKKYLVEFKDGKMPPQLLVSKCSEIRNFEIDYIARNQMWDCPESEQILQECKYHVVAADFLGNAMDYKERAEMIMDFTEALVEMFPQCKAVLFQNSFKMFTRDKILNHDIPKEMRFIYFAVNTRLFNVQGTDEKVVDTVGMGLMGLPDVQYHFKDFDPNLVANHAYNIASYIFDNNCPIESGDVIDGIKDGKISREVAWKCQFENSLIGPKRPLLDICMGEFAAGVREKC